MKKIITLVCLLMCLVTMASAQFSQFHAGLSFPTGKFGDGDYASDLMSKGKGFAAMGLTAGYKYYSPLAIENMSWVFGIEAFYNGLNSDGKDGLEDNSFRDLRYPMYFNFPLTFGLNYAIPLQSGLKLYGEVGVGGNFSLPTNLSYSDSDSYQDMTYKFTSTFGFAYRVEGGIFISDKYSLGLSYNNLGSYKYKYKVEYESKSSDKGKFGKALAITNISLCFGFLF